MQQKQQLDYGNGRILSANRKNIRKPRRHIVTLDMGKPVTFNGVSLNRTTGKVSLLFNGRPVFPETAILRVGYDRNKGFKSLVRANTHRSLLYPNPNRVLEQYDLLLAVDTNWKVVGSERIAITSIVYGRITKVSVPGHTGLHFSAKECFEYRNPTCKPENLGWQQTIVMLQRNPEYHCGLKVAIIVDSDLGLLDSYNGRVEPIIDGFYLPDNFKLLYASSDSPSESGANRMIALADKISRDVLNQVIASSDMSNLTKLENQTFSMSRRWELP